MPPYDIHLVVKPMVKDDIVKAMKRICLGLIGQGAVIEKIESLGYRDLPYRRTSKLINHPIYTSNQFMLKAYMPMDRHKEASVNLRTDLDLLGISFVNRDKLKGPINPDHCDLEEFMKPAVQRSSVQQMRSMQRLGHFLKWRYYKSAEKKWKGIVKMYPVGITKK